ncbi:hypothetical protein BDV96DRAFT_571353 [Lophiotrema nucula]|uniref:Smr domain-containing protein n=1 Tax=Lophiotrema nucula TaxID=690887 RepID=A0A6A5ZCQ2_9PLEO|nr:hypothetical protein BDV96DRAFT_571353 [Lophiotrema nucula]
MDESLQLLEKEYCPPVDPALVHAIYSDFADAPDGLQSARDLLNGIKRSALDEQTTDFDPSGSSGDALRSSPGKQGSDEVDSSATESWRSQTTVTDCTNLSSDIATLSLGARSPAGSDESSDGGYFYDCQTFDTQTKEDILVGMFPTLRPDFVIYILKKSNGEFEKATEELLNHSYFEDSKSSPTEELVISKGIDAFSEENHIPYRAKKGKAKRKQKANNVYGAGSASASDSDVAAAPPRNKWADGNRDVEFIASRTKLPSTTVSSVYHTSGASIAATILTLINKDIALHRKDKEPDAGLVQNALDLVTDFPSLELGYALALIRLTAPSTANAHQLAKALNGSNGFTSTARSGIHVIPRYAPIDVSNAPETSPALPNLPPSALPHSTVSLAAARSTAFTQASAAYRKGNSNPLMKSAAGYYSQVGRDLNTNLRALNESEADQLVASQSSPTFLDLHGVTVSNSTRIAKERVQAWYDGLGEQRIPGGGRRGVGDGYRIITGLGRHSEGGRSKIGPAVARTLVNAGWKVEIGTGELTVMGLARRR